MWMTDGDKCYIYACQKAQVLAAIPEGTMIGSVLEVHIVKILNRYGMEVAIPSLANPMNTSYVIKSRETERFVNEIDDHKRRAEVQ